MSSEEHEGPADLLTILTGRERTSLSEASSPPWRRIALIRLATVEDGSHDLSRGQ